jgi:catechol 2,3-dioxygenase-like lactoylglutathione lyase family enzyme
MAVLGPYGITLQVPEIEPGVQYYAAAGLQAKVDGDVARLSCDAGTHECITLLGGAPRKRLHHLTLRADPELFDEVRRAIPAQGGQLIAAPKGFSADGVWLEDPHGLRVHLVDAPPENEPTCPEPFSINGPGRVVRENRSAMLAKAKTADVRPVRLGHVLLFSPDVSRSVQFFSDALGMGLADRAQDVIAFMCARHGSDHHVVAFAKSPGIGFHHASFLVSTPDDVGRGGRRLSQLAKRGHWGFGRHTIGSNFFHYIQDPWGSWFEYYSDIDYIADYAKWSPTNYGMEDSLDNWGPDLPQDFVHNYEVDVNPYRAAEQNA